MSAESWGEMVNETLTKAEADGRHFEVLSNDPEAVFAFRSHSDPQEFYYCIRLPWITVCTCKGFRFRSDCSHVRELDEGVDRKGAEGVR